MGPINLSRKMRLTMKMIYFKVANSANNNIKYLIHLEEKNAQIGFFNDAITYYARIVRYCMMRINK
jgi:hypothetical protein